MRSRVSNATAYSPAVRIFSSTTLAKLTVACEISISCARPVQQFGRLPKRALRCLEQGFANYQTLGEIRLILVPQFARVARDLPQLKLAGGSEAYSAKVQDCPMYSVLIQNESPSRSAEL